MIFEKVNVILGILLIGAINRRGLLFLGTNLKADISAAREEKAYAATWCFPNGSLFPYEYLEILVKARRARRSPGRICPESTCPP